MANRLPMVRVKDARDNEEAEKRRRRASAARRTAGRYDRAVQYDGYLSRESDARAERVLLVKQHFSKVVQKLIPQLPTLENLLNALISNCNMEKSFLFDVVSKVYIATDSNPVDVQS